MTTNNLPSQAFADEIDQEVVDSLKSDVECPTPADSTVATTGVDTTRLDKADIKQLRKNINRLKSRVHVDGLRKVTHFDIRSFFQLGKK